MWKNYRFSPKWALTFYSELQEFLLLKFLLFCCKIIKVTLDLIGFYFPFVFLIIYSCFAKESLKPP